MVTRRPSGKSRLGCLFSLLVLAVVVYYGLGIGSVYLRYWQISDQMHEMANLAPSLADATIHKRLVAKATDLDLPPEATRFVIRRFDNPRQIRISTSYSETIVLPFTTYTIHFHPEARAAL
jgi:hypothetical protein